MGRVHRLPQGEPERIAAFKLIRASAGHRCMVGASRLVVLARAVFDDGVLIERPEPAPA